MNAAHTTVSQLLADAAQNGIDRLDAQILLLSALGKSPQDRAWLLTHDTDELAADTQDRFQTLCQRRLTGEPVAYLLGEKEFFGLKLQVDDRVLVPRPDTETLVDWALSLLADTPEPRRVIDLGTGSGAIALSLAHAAPVHTHVTATDASSPALTVAAANAIQLGLNVRFTQGHWLSAVPGETFDLIVSNPPYIAEGDPHLPALSHEPISALTSGADGLNDIRIIIQEAPDHLLPGGWLLLEHGHDQAVAVRALLRDAGMVDVDSKADLAGIERCSGGRWPGRR